MAVGCYLPSGVYLSVANPPSRDAESGFTMFGWFHVPTYTAGDFHSTMLLNYVTNDVGEGFQFYASSATQSQGFVMCYPPEFTSIGGTYSSGTWYFQAEVYTRSEGVTTRRTYISATAGGTPVLISTQTWTVADASPEWFDIGYARGYVRSLIGTMQYVGVAPVAMSLAELAAQSNSATPTVSCWVFITGDNGSYVDSSGNNRTIVATGTPQASSVSAPLEAPSNMVSTIAIGQEVGATIQAVGSIVASTTVGVDLSASTSPLSDLIAGTTISIVHAGTLEAIGSIVANASISADINSASIETKLPRIICYGNSVTAGYGISDPSLHYPEQLKLLLGDRVENVVKLGYSGVATATLDSQFATNVGPYIESDRRCILIWQEVFNSAHSGVSADDIMTSYWSVCAKARALGCEVIVQDTSAADADSQAHPEVVSECNARMESQWGAHADGYVKISTTFYDPTDTTLYQSDGAHFTALGLYTLAQLNYEEVDRLLLNQSFIAELGASSTMALELDATGYAINAIAASLDITVESINTIGAVGNISADVLITTAVESGTSVPTPMVADTSITSDITAADVAGIGSMTSSHLIGLEFSKAEMLSDSISASIDITTEVGGRFASMLGADMAFGMELLSGVESTVDLASDIQITTELDGRAFEQTINSIASDIQIATELASSIVGLQYVDIVADVAVGLDIVAQAIASQVGDMFADATIGIELTGSPIGATVDLVTIESFTNDEVPVALPFTSFRVWDSDGNELNLGIVQRTNQFGTLTFELGTGSFRFLLSKLNWIFDSAYIDITSTPTIIRFTARPIDTSWLKWEDLELVVDRSVIDKLFNDTNSNSRDMVLVEQSLQQAEALSETEMLRSWTRDQIVILASGDPAIRAQAAWIAMEFASERRQEFISADGKGRYWAQYERSMNYFKALGKSQCHSRSERSAGHGSNAGGAVRPRIRYQESRRIFADEPDGKKHGGF